MRNFMCESCGMALKEEANFGGRNLDNRYCVYCCNEQGNLKSRAEVLAGMTTFAMKSKCLSQESAHQFAEDRMAKMPAWKRV